MLLKVKILHIDSGGKPIVFLNDKDADELNVTASERVTIQAKKKIICFKDIKDERPLPALLGHHSDLQKIQKVDYSNLKTLEKVQDLFVFDPQEISI